MRTLSLLLAVCVAAGSAAAETRVPADAIAGRIAQAIEARLPAPGRYRAALADPGFMLMLPASAQGVYDIAALTFDPARQSFSAALAYTSASGEREYVRIAGHAAAVVEVPVLLRDVAAGETIADADLTTIEIAADRLNAQTLTSSEAVAGLAARRALRAKTPLLAYDVKKPVVVKKGELITVIYADGGIELSAQGQAQTDAGKGDTIAVLNTRSRRTIEARVTAPGQAVVTAPAAAR